MDKPNAVLRSIILRARCGYPNAIAFLLKVSPKQYECLKNDFEAGSDWEFVINDLKTAKSFQQVDEALTPIRSGKHYRAMAKAEWL